MIRHRNTVVFRWLLAAAFGLLMSGCAFTVTERNIIAPRADAVVVAGQSKDGQWQVNPVAVTTADGVTLRGAWYRRPHSKAVALYFGGNGLTLNRAQESLLAIYQAMPTDVVVFDHRGYGGSAAGEAAGDAPPAVHFNDLFDDGLTIFDWLAQTMRADGDTRPVIVHGQSLGSFVAGQLATRRNLDGLVLESSATTTEDWVVANKARMPWYVRWFIRVHIDASMQGQGNAQLMGRIHAPLLVLVGGQDTTTPPAMSRALFQAAATPPADKELLVIEQANHNTAALSPQFAAAWRRLLERATERRERR